LLPASYTVIGGVVAPDGADGFDEHPQQPASESRMAIKSAEPSLHRTDPAVVLVINGLQQVSRKAKSGLEIVNFIDPSSLTPCRSSRDCRP
jgi:hypothetical protein